MHSPPARSADTAETARRPLQLLRVLWASPNTLLGLALGAFCALTGGSLRLVDGVIEAEGGWIGLFFGRNPFVRGGIAAMTLGHVVVGRSAAELDRTRIHERVHVEQYERWGPLFLPAYFASSAWCVLRGRHPYRANAFEVEAYRLEAERRALGHARGETI
ncbi:MAG: hypothetical protein AAGA20_24125 [Planctomycetota bacterium]